MSFIRFDVRDITVSTENISTPVWTTDEPILTEFHTSSVQVVANSGQYYVDVYQTGSELSNADVQFSIAYGHNQGSGSLLYNDAVAERSPTSTIYSQYKLLLLGNEDPDFTFSGYTAKDIFVINFERARYKGNLLPGTFNLHLSGSGNPATITLTDNSEDVTTVTYTDAGRVYDIVSGSDGSAASGVGTGGATDGYTISGSYGKLYPDVGIAVLNAEALNLSVANGGINLGLSRNSDTDDNVPQLLFEAIEREGYFKINNEEVISSLYVFVRARNDELNYSTNPSYITGSGELRHDRMIEYPQTYFTTIGLYNDRNDLLAIAKLSRPQLKDFTKEALVRVKLDF